MMKRVSKIALLAAATLGIVRIAAQGQSGNDQATRPITVDINVSRTAPPTSKYEFGMFIENIGPLVYRSLWSEMLDDRKFSAPITAAKADAQSQRHQVGMPGMTLRKWRPVGPADTVTMDGDQPFVGDHSPRISLDGTAPRGIRQSGLAVVKGKQYVGHICLKGTPGSTVKVALISGDGKEDRETATFAHLTSAYKKFPFRFTAKAGSSDAAFEITGTGMGSFHVGTVSVKCDAYMPTFVDVQVCFSPGKTA